MHNKVNEIQIQQIQHIQQSQQIGADEINSPLMFIFSSATSRKRHLSKTSRKIEPSPDITALNT